MLIQLLITIVGWLVLIYLGTNLLGFFVRGLFSNPEIDRLASEGHEFIKKEAKKHQRIDKLITVVALVINIAFFYLLFHFWNFGVLIAAIMIIISRLPDLIWEIKHGKKINTKTMPKNVIYYITNLLIWAALPVLYFYL